MGPALLDGPDVAVPDAAVPDGADLDVVAPDVAVNDLGTGTGLLAAATGGRGTDFASTGWGRGWVKVD